VCARAASKRLGASVRPRRAKPRSARPAPISAIRRVPGPVPVKARALELVVTTELVVPLGEVVVVLPLALVVVVVGGVELPPLAKAITGSMGFPVGAEVTIPVGTESLAYAVHVRLSWLPETVSVRLALASSSIVIPPPEAVKGPMVLAGLGRSKVSPELGTVLGMGTSKLSVPLDIVVGVAPATSSCAVAVPEMSVLPNAAAASTRVCGRFATV